MSRKAEAVGRDRYAAACDRFLAGSTGVTELNMAQSEMESASLRYLQDMAAWWEYYYDIRQMTLYDYFKDRIRVIIGIGSFCSGGPAPQSRLISGCLL